MWSCRVCDWDCHQSCVDGDATLAHIEALGNGISSCPSLRVLNMASCMLGSKSITILASTFSKALLESMDISKNAIEVDGAKALVSMLPGSSIKTLTFGPKSTKINLQMNALEPEPEEETSVNFSKQELGPTELIIIAYWFSTDATAVLEEVDISGNFITGTRSKDNDGQAPWIYDDDMSGFEEFCKVLPSSPIKTIKMAGNKMGPKSIVILASTLNTALVDEVDLSNNRFDPSLLTDIEHVKLNLTGCSP